MPEQWIPLRLERGDWRLALLKYGVIASSLFALCIGLIRAQPYRDDPLRHLLQSPANCPKPCWHHIRPGETTTEEFIRLLQTDPWVQSESIERFDRNKLCWQWSGMQPALIDSTTPGQAVLSNGRVFSLTLPLNIGMGDLQLLFGAPFWGSRGRYQHEAFIQYSYPREHLTLLIEVDCPMARQSYWHIQPTITLSQGPMRGASFAPHSQYLKLC
ncbi:MAG: hypothetical protein K8L99_12680 [Anaerolineae bacterium]|nr:hypothetical protein [Anaerolineae bacterium]